MVAIHAILPLSSECTELIDTWKPLLGPDPRFTNRNCEVFDILLVLYCFLMFFGEISLSVSTLS